jgi:hypothetical protein
MGQFVGRSTTTSLRRRVESDAVDQLHKPLVAGVPRPAESLALFLRPAWNHQTNLHDVRAMLMRALLLVMLGSLLLTGCQTDHSIPMDRQAYVGTYAYKSMDTAVDKPTDHELDRLVLKADGKYLLVRGGSTKPKTETEGIWNLVNGSQQPNIELDHAGYPVRVKRGEIRLLINDDLGEWYAKAK